MGKVIEGRWPHIAERKAARDAGLQRFEHEQLLVLVGYKQAAAANAVFIGLLLVAVGLWTLIEGVVWSWV